LGWPRRGGERQRLGGFPWTKKVGRPFLPSPEALAGKSAIFSQDKKDAKKQEPVKGTITEGI